MPPLSLTIDELLSTTRAVRKRLNFDKPVARALLAECLELALQAPSGSNAQGWQFVFVDDASKKAEIAELYRTEFAAYATGPMSAGMIHQGDKEKAATQARVLSSAQYLADNLHRTPVFLIPCIAGRTNVGDMSKSTAFQSSIFGSILPAVWSFMLAARSRGLGTCLTTLHLLQEEKVANILGIPYNDIMQVGLVPIAYTKGTSFQPAGRTAASSVSHFNYW